MLYGVFMIKTTLLFVLCPKNLIRISLSSLEEILIKIKIKLETSLLEIGLPIGILTALCLSEAIT